MTRSSTGPGSGPGSTKSAQTGPGLDFGQSTVNTEIKPKFDFYPYSTIEF